MEKNKKRSRRFVGQEEIKRLLSLWKKSGQSKKDFTTDHGINYTTFSKWVRNSGTSPDVKIKTEKKQSDFVGFTFNEKLSPLLEIIYSNGNRICFYSEVDCGLIKTLLS